MNSFLFYFERLLNKLIMTFILEISNSIATLDLVTSSPTMISTKTDKIMVNIVKLTIFIYKKVASGNNCVSLVPSLRKKINDLYSSYVEECEKEVGVETTEGEYLERVNGAMEERANTLELLDMLELGLPIKCIVN